MTGPSGRRPPREVRGGQTSSILVPSSSYLLFDASKSQTHGTCSEATPLETRSTVQVSTKNGTTRGYPIRSQCCNRKMVLAVFEVAEHCGCPTYLSSIFHQRIHSRSEHPPFRISLLTLLAASLSFISAGTRIHVDPSVMRIRPPWPVLPQHHSAFSLPTSSIISPPQSALQQTESLRWL